jgi:hypothetical protein
MAGSTARGGCNPMSGTRRTATRRRRCCRHAPRAAPSPSCQNTKVSKDNSGRARQWHPESERAREASVCLCLCECECYLCVRVLWCRVGALVPQVHVQRVYWAEGSHGAQRTQLLLTAGISGKASVPIDRRAASPLAVPSPLPTLPPSEATLALALPPLAAAAAATRARLAAAGLLLVVARAGGDPDAPPAPLSRSTSAAGRAITDSSRALYSRTRSYTHKARMHRQSVGLPKPPHTTVPMERGTKV